MKLFSLILLLVGLLSSHSASAADLSSKQIVDGCNKRYMTGDINACIVYGSRRSSHSVVRDSVEFCKQYLKSMNEDVCIYRTIEFTAKYYPNQGLRDAAYLAGLGMTLAHNGKWIHSRFDSRVLKDIFIAIASFHPELIAQNAWVDDHAYRICVWGQDGEELCATHNIYEKSDMDPVELLERIKSGKILSFGKAKEQQELLEAKRQRELDMKHKEYDRLFRADGEVSR
jgi:hypothetical protein